MVKINENNDIMSPVKSAVVSLARYSKYTAYRMVRFKIDTI